MILTSLSNIYISSTNVVIFLRHPQWKQTTNWNKDGTKSLLRYLCFQAANQELSVDSCHTSCLALISICFFLHFALIINVSLFKIFNNNLLKITFIITVKINNGGRLTGTKFINWFMRLQMSYLWNHIDINQWLTWI